MNRVYKIAGVSAALLLFSSSLVLAACPAKPTDKLLLQKSQCYGCLIPKKYYSQGYKYTGFTVTQPSSTNNSAYDVGLCYFHN